MNTTIIKLTAILFLTLSVTSCGVDMFNRIDGDGNVITQKRNIDPEFSRVRASNGLDVYITQGDKVSVVVEADENLHDIIITEVRGDQLRIYTDKNIYRAKARKVHVTVKDITELKATSGSDVYSEGILKLSDIDLSTSSGADMKVEIDANNVTTSSSSGSDLKVSGQANNHNANASSGSSVHAYKLEAKSVTAKVSSGADINVYASESIDAKASSGGNIRYKGSPEKVNKKTSSGGGVSSRS